MSYPPGPPSGGDYGSYGRQHQQPYGNYGQQPQFGGSFGQGSTYSGGLYGGPQPPKKRGGVIAAVAVVSVLLLSGIGVGGYFLLGDDDQKDPPAAQPTTTPPSQSSSESTSPGATTTEKSYTPQEIAIEPITAGWRGVWVPKDRVAYDVPKKDWTVATPGTTTGWENADGKPVASFHGVSDYRKGWCKAKDWWSRAVVGVQSVGAQEREKAARVGAIYFGAAIAKKPQKPASVDESKAKDVRINGGKTTASVSTATVPISYDKSDPKKCREARTTKITSVAFNPEPKQTSLLIIVADQGGKAELPQAEVDKIVKSLRPHEG